ncbi:MAG: hypothetical protein AAF192_13110, partial [Pseudomonadota bacterium]
PVRDPARRRGRRMTGGPAAGPENWKRPRATLDDLRPLHAAIDWGGRDDAPDLEQVVVRTVLPPPGVNHLHRLVETLRTVVDQAHDHARQPVAA